MSTGNRIYYNQEGKVLFATGERSDITINRKEETINYIDLEFGDKTLNNVLEYHIDILSKKIIIDKKVEVTEVKESQLEKELLKAKSTIVDLQYKNLLNNKEGKVGK